MDTHLIINATQSGKKVAKAISNINPVKDNAILKEFAQRINGLTTNIYVDATRINKQSVEETGGGLVIDSTNFTGTAPTVSDIEGGKRLTFGESGYIDVTFS